MKTYTDISQSRELAKILPLESADMKILPFTEREYRIVPINDIAVCGRDDEIYAWSLAALLGVLPYPHIEQNYKGKWTCSVEHGNTTYLWEDSNPIDACVTMIEKLHEQNLL